MDANRFDTLTRSLTGVPSRRMLLRGLAGVPLGLVLARVPGVASAKKRKKTKIKRNGFGCVNVGNACKNGGQCCSGICGGKKGKRKCQAHNEGGCTVERNLCGTGSALNSCGPENVCLATSGNAGFCASLRGTTAEVNCQICRTDKDCENLEFPSGSACVIFTGPVCANAIDCNGINGSKGTICLPPAA